MKAGHRSTSCFTGQGQRVQRQSPACWKGMLSGLSSNLHFYSQEESIQWAGGLPLGPGIGSTPKEPRCPHQHPHSLTHSYTFTHTYTHSHILAHPSSYSLTLSHANTCSYIYTTVHSHSRNSWMSNPSHHKATDPLPTHCSCSQHTPSHSQLRRAYKQAKMAFALRKLFLRGTRVWIHTKALRPAVGET